MKFRIAFVFIGFTTFLLSSCGGDNEAPTYVINQSLQENYIKGEFIDFELTFMDESQFAFIRTTITETNQSSLSIVESPAIINSEEYIHKHRYQLNSPLSGTLQVLIEAEDEQGNSLRDLLEYEYTGFKCGNLNASFRLIYEDRPLIMFEDYTYPDGHNIQFSRVSLFTSNLQLGDGPVSSAVHFHNLTDAHDSEEKATLGYSYEFDNVPVGNYNSMSMLVGLTPELNALLPGDFSSENPLSKAAEHWFSWKSYIFVKVEGTVDTDGDGEKETAFAFHLGADEAAQLIQLDRSLNIIEGETSDVVIDIDIAQMLQSDNRVYPVEEAPQLHSLSQIDYVLELAENFKNSFK